MVDSVIKLANKDEDNETIDLTSRVYKLVVNHGKEGVLQSVLWKELNLTSRDGSRLAIRLERRGMIKRDKTLDGGRWTYKLSPVRMPVQIGSIEHCPCITCPVESRCTPDGGISPHTCPLIIGWTVEEYNSSNSNKSKI